MLHIFKTGALTSMSENFRDANISFSLINFLSSLLKFITLLTADKRKKASQQRRTLQVRQPTNYMYFSTSEVHNSDFNVPYDF